MSSRLNNDFKKDISNKSGFRIYIYICFVIAISIIYIVKIGYFFVCLPLFLALIFIIFKNRVSKLFMTKMLFLVSFYTTILNFIFRLLKITIDIIFIRELIFISIVIISSKFFVSNLLKLIKVNFNFINYKWKMEKIYLDIFEFIALIICFIARTIYDIYFKNGKILMISSLILFIVILNIIIMLNFIIVIFYLDSDKKSSIMSSIKMNYYNELIVQLKKHIDELKKLRHDFKNHILGISALMNNKRYEDLSKYLKKMFLDEKITANNFISTGNLIIDVILNNKISEAIDLNIEVDTNIYIPPELSIDEFEFIVVLGNILDNAIEATCKLKEDERYIKILISYNERKTLTISVKNAYNGEKEFLKNKTSKNDKANHGIGLKSIKQIMDKNNGFFEINYDEKTFEIKIMFYEIEIMENKKV